MKRFCLRTVLGVVDALSKPLWTEGTDRWPSGAEPDQGVPAVTHSTGTFQAM